MRITNNMMLRNTAYNINGNKTNVDKTNNQMTSQKKIQRPSEDPVIAIRALRLRSSLSEIDQYYENNIPDAEAWLDVTHTALYNMTDILKTIREQCVYGANDSLKTEDRNAILEQLQSMRAQIYSEGNADYAGRTVFTGYRTNKTLTFMTEETSTSYEISQGFSYKDIEEHRYYSGAVTVPTTATEALNNAISNPAEATYSRIRLGYDGIDSLTGVVMDPTTGQPDTDPVTGEILTESVTTGTTALAYTNADGTTGYMNVTVYETYGDWAAASADGTYDITDGEAVLIRQTGELILADDIAAGLKSGNASITLDYQKTGFSKGEVRPEYYYNCTNVTDPANPVKFEKFDADGNEIYQDINFNVAQNQTLTVNTTASRVFDSSIGRDVDELIEAVQSALNAKKKVADIEEMMNMDEYASDECQKALENWMAAAQKELDYAEDNMQKLYDSYIGNCDDYLEQVNLALTEVGNKQQSLALTETRMSSQQTTIEALKSSNEDREISDIILDYTAAYNAYQASLQAGAKINQNTLLNYI
ncbi:MAG: flagellar hook-associated protein 3 [Roseburia sp.]